MKKARLFSFFLTLALLLTTLPVSAAPILISPAPQRDPAAGWLIQPMKSEAEFPDVTGSWCEAAVDTVYRTGLMQGKTAERFDAASPLTYAQITVVTARLHHLLNGGDGVLPASEEGEVWYQSAVDYLKAQSNDETLLYLLKQLERDDEYPNTPCIRRSFVQMLSAVLPENALTPINDISVIPDLAINEADILPFYRAGILNGSDAYGTFGQETTLSRGAAAAIMARLVDPQQRLTFVLKSFDLCRDVLGVEPDTVLLTVNGEEIPAELFAEQLCTSLYQWEGNAANAKKDAIRFWCWYQGSFRILAEELGVSIPADKQEEIRLEAEEKDGYLGLPAVYWQFRSEGSSLNLMMRNLYWEKDWKWGESYYHNDLEDVSEAMTQNAVPAPALETMDLSAVYQRLMKSPFVQWQFHN